LKRFTYDEDGTGAHALNRTRLELKPINARIKQIHGTALNRTRLELKLGTTENTEHTEKTLNHTISEWRHNKFRVFRAHTGGVFRGSLNHTISVWGIKKAPRTMLKAFTVNPLGLPGCTGTGFSPWRG
jgi:hypothetical protein